MGKPVSAAISCMVAGALASGPPAEAGALRRGSGAPALVLWVHPERLSAGRRAMLSRVLVGAVEGQPLRGVAVRDSRPELVVGARAAVEPGDRRCVDGKRTGKKTPERTREADENAGPPCGLESAPLGYKTTVRLPFDEAAPSRRERSL